MIRLFASDLDGTLLNENHETDDIIFDAVSQINEHNCIFAVATGRHMHFNQLELLGFKKGSAYYVSMNGAMVLDRNENIIIEKPLNSDFVKDLLHAFPDFMFECYGKTHTFLRQSREEQVANFKKRSIWSARKKPFPFEQVSKDCIYSQTNEQILSQTIYKINCRVQNKEEEKQLQQFIERYPEEVMNAPFAPECFEFTRPDANKGNAIKQLAEMLNIKEDEVAVYGDGGNDLQMLSSFKHSYATENACDEAKALALEVIGNCADHAVPKHMVKTLKNK